MTDYISPRQFHDSEGLEDWRVLGDGAYAYFRTSSFAEGARLVQAISELPGVDDHHPDVDVRHDGVTVRLITVTDDYCGMSRRDVEVARQISAAARELGLPADPAAVQSLLVIPGAPVSADVMPFWRAVLGYEPRRDSPDQDLVDPRSRGTSFWLEQMNEPRPDGGGSIHVAIWVPFEQAEARIAAARRGRPDGTRRVRSLVVDAGRRLGQRGRHRHHHGPRLTRFARIRGDLAMQTSRRVRPTADDRVGRPNAEHWPADSNQANRPLTE